jgi:hypothetical protein
MDVAIGGRAMDGSVCGDFARQDLWDCGNHGTADDLKLEA